MTPSSAPFWPKGVPRTLSLPQVPLTHYVQVAAERYPNKPAVIFCGSTLTYAALLALWRRWPVTSCSAWVCNAAIGSC